MEDSKKYFISLDNIDIDYLPRLKEYMQGNECNEVPLWSVVNASKSADEICEFELFTKDDKDTTTSECDENNSTEQCYICDTQVPTTYMQAHCTGEKHRICASILRQALHRAAQHAECIPFAPTGLTTKPVSLTHSESTYFCDPCALSVNVENKDTHEKTKEHQVSVIHDRLLNGLLITYTDKGRVVADSRYEAEVSNGSDVVSVEDISRDDDVATTPVDDVEIAVAADTAYEINSDKDEQGIVEEKSDAESIDTIDNNVDLSDDNWVKLSSNSLTDQANINYQGDATTFNEQDDIQIVTVSDGRVKVAAKNYHGISYKLTGGISCLVCQKTIVDVEAHILETRHIDLVSIPVLDRNCIRQINQVWHHCIICNKLVQSIPLHKSSSPHQSKLLALDIAIKHQRLQNKLNRMPYCELCHCNLSKNNIEEHLNGARHAWHLSRTNFTADNRVLHHHFKKNEDEIECAICNIVVSDDDTDAHIKSEGHENNYKRFLVTNHISRLNHRAFYCDCCKLKFRQKVTTEIEHVQNISHKIHKIKVSDYTPNVSIPVNVNSIESAECLDVATIQLLYLLETSNIAKRVTCKICKHTFRNKATKIKNHMNQSYHQYNIDALLYVNKIKNKLDGTYFCEVCRSTIDHTKEFNHINNNDHKINLRNEPQESKKECGDISKVAETPAEKYSCDQDIIIRNAPDDMNVNDMSGVAVSLAENPPSKNVDILDRHTVGNSKRKLHSHLKKIKDIIVCLICNDEVRANDIDAHTESEEHSNNYKCFVVTNHLTKSKSGYNCHACDVKTDISEIVHVNKKKHKLKIRVYKPETSDPVDVHSIQDIEFRDRKLLYLLESSDEPGEIRCKVCKDTMKGDSMQIKEHLAEKYHQFNVDALLYVNKIKNKLDGTYFCEVCRSSINRTKEMDHINSNDHKINIRNVPLSSRQRGDDTTGAPFTLSENPCCRENVKNSCDSDINVEIAPLSCREKGNDMSTSAVPTKTYLTYYLENTTSNVENDHNTVDTSKVQRELNSHLNEIKDETVCFICNVDVHADDIESYNESVHIINVRNVPLSWRQIGDDMAGAAATPVENSSSNLNIKDSYDDHKINVRNAPLACREKGNDMTRETVTSNAENDHNTDNTDNSKREIHSHLKEIKDEKASFICNVDVRADAIDSQNESNHNINVRNVPLSCILIDDDMTGVAAAASEQPTSSRNVKDSNDHEINMKIAPLPCEENDSYNCRVAVSPDENPTSNVCVLDRTTVHNNNRKLHYHLKIVKDEIVCSICNIALRDVDIDAHIESDEHNINYKTFLVENQITMHKKGSFCHTCRYYMKKTMCETDHIKNKIHIEKMSVHKPKPAIPVDLNTIQHIKLLDFATAKLLYLLELCNDEREKITCKVCKVTMKCNSVQIKKHMTDQYHQFNMDALLYVNKIKNKDGTYFCEVCRSIIGHTKEIDHINRNDHKINVRSWAERDNDISNAAVTPTENSTSNVNVRETLNHIEFEKHKQEIIVQNDVVSLQAIKGIKDFDKIIPIDSEKYFCECCSVHLVKGTVSEHVEKYNHAINVAKYIEKQKTSTSKVKDNNVEKCASNCKKNVEIPNVKLISHEVNDYFNFKDGEILHANSSPTGRPKVKKDSKHDMNSYLSAVPSNPHEVMCQICNAVIPKNDNNIKDHLNGKRHKTNYEMFLVDKKQLKTVKDCDINVTVTAAKTTKNDTFKTEAFLKAQAIERIEDCDKIIPIDSECSVHLVKGTVSEHVENYNHAINLAKYIDVQKTSTSKFKDKIIENYTSNCIKYIDGFKDGATSHASKSTTGSSEVKKDSKHDMNSYLSVVTSKPYKVMCQICNTGLTNNDANIKDHLNGRRHKTNYENFLFDKKKQLKTKEKLPCDNVKEPAAAKTTKNYSIDSSLDMNSCLSSVPSKPHEVMCQACNTVIPNTDANKKDHLKGRRHKSNYEKFLVDKKQLKTVKNCDINVKVPVAKTTKNDTHKTEALVKAQSIFFKYAEGVLFCRCCNTEVRNTLQDVNLHLSGWRHKVKSSAILAENGLRVDKNKIYCDVCNEFLPNLDGITHIDSFKHKAKVSAKALEYFSADKDVIAPAAKTNDSKSDKCKISNNNKNTNRESSLQDNLLKAKDEKKEGAKGVYCDVCKVYVMNMPVHLNSNQHKLTMNLKINDDMTCKVCNLKVNKNDLKQHENGALHNKNFKEILLKNQISQKWNGVLYCQLCDLFFTPVSLIGHVENENHKKIMYRLVGL